MLTNKATLVATLGWGYLTENIYYHFLKLFETFCYVVFCVNDVQTMRPMLC